MNEYNYIIATLMFICFSCLLTNKNSLEAMSPMKQNCIHSQWDLMQNNITISGYVYVAISGNE